MSSKRAPFPGSLHPQRAGDGRDGLGDEHDRDFAPDRGAEQDRERGGRFSFSGGGSGG